MYFAVLLEFRFFSVLITWTDSLSQWGRIVNFSQFVSVVLLDSFFGWLLTWQARPSAVPALTLVTRLHEFISRAGRTVRSKYNLQQTHWMKQPSVQRKAIRLLGIFLSAGTVCHGEGHQTELLYRIYRDLLVTFFCKVVYFSHCLPPNCLPNPL